MRAAVMYEVDASLDRPLLRFEDRPMPTPVTGHDVVVRVAGAGVCRSDLHLLRGELQVDLPHVLGHENAGYVEAVGTDVTTVAVGDPVLCYPFQSDGLSAAERRGIDSIAPDRRTPGIDVDGGYAEFMLATERAMIPLPSGVDPAHAAPLADAGLAAYRAARKAAPLLGPGSTAVVLGAGGLGHLGIQILGALTPATIVAVDPKPAARELALRSGAAQAITPDELAGSFDGTASAVLDFVGHGETLHAGLRALSFGGVLLVVGVGGRLEVDALDLVAAEARVEGVYVGTYQELVELLELFVAGDVRPEVVTYPLSKAEQALRALDAGEIAGRAVLVADEAG